MFLRKHLGGYFLTEIKQVEPERILKIEFRVKDSVKFLYIEMFGKGNMILTDSDHIILNALEQHEFKGRTIKPKIRYIYPSMKYNFFDLKKDELILMLEKSNKDSIVTSLATELGLGGIYSEEVCLIALIDKKKSPSEIDLRDVGRIFSALNELLNRKINPFVVFDDGNPVDFIPFDLKFYSSFRKEKFDSFNGAVSYFYSQFKEVRESAEDKKMKSLSRIIKEQQLNLEELRNEEALLREKAELIYQNYHVVNDVISEINKASKKFTWKEIKEKLKGHNIVKEINEKERKVVIEI